jgi:hypothetical protein
MSFSQVSLLFLLQMALGSLATFPLTDREELGPKYFKFGGWVLLGLYGLALTLVAGPALDASASGPLRVLGLAVAAAALGLLGFSSVSGWDRPRLETALLWFSLLAGGVAVWVSALHWLPGALPASEPPESGVDRALVVAGAFGSAAVLGFSTWGMILGHWYLVAQGLPIRHLARLVRPLPWLFGIKTVLSLLAIWLMWDRFLGPGNRSLDDILNRQPERILDVVNVWARVPVGLVVPAIMAFMTKVTVRMERTQPATGILYAMCVTVYLGDLIGKMVEGATGVPL